MKESLCKLIDNYSKQLKNEELMIIRNKSIRLNNHEYEMVKKARELILLKGTDSLICLNCGWKPKFINLSYGETIDVGLQFLFHFIENPKCFEMLKQKV